MKKTIFTFGLISGVIVVALMFLTLPFTLSKDDFGHGQLLGYTTMIISLSAIYFAIRSYRDNQAGGTITFGKAFLIGLGITAMASILYVIGWKVYSALYMPDFAERYFAHSMQQLEQSGAPAAEIAAKKEEMLQFKELYKNPVIEFGMTLLEIFPVGLVISLLCAALLKRKPKLQTVA